MMWLSSNADKGLSVLTRTISQYTKLQSWVAYSLQSCQIAHFRELPQHLISWTNLWVIYHFVWNQESNSVCRQTLWKGQNHYTKYATQGHKAYKRKKNFASCFKPTCQQPIVLACSWSSTRMNGNKRIPDDQTSSEIESFCTFKTKVQSMSWN